ncbi:hypothetical protein Tco_0875938 [Tanacetum coccineum]|uniref:Uncharacterized protein n=1 Tax=Tanacetum coccineum TaxID=301880 RepID=A0ABQ5BTS8_9ASTR
MITRRIDRINAPPYVCSPSFEGTMELSYAFLYLEMEVVEVEFGCHLEGVVIVEKIRIKTVLLDKDYALWEVIENGNSWVPIPVTTPESGPSTALKMIVPSTTEEKICKKNDVKARSLLLMALPNEHQLTFNQYADAQSMFIAKSSFGGNDATISFKSFTGNTKVNTASTETSTASFSDATVYAFLSTQPQGSQLVHEDLEQLHDDDLEEMDLK